MELVYIRHLKCRFCGFESHQALQEKCPSLRWVFSAKLQTLIKFAIACGVGPSLKVLEKRALDVTKLLLPYEPNDIVAELAAHKAANPNFGIEQVHFFPLGGIKTNANWAIENGGMSARPANAA